jgi:hypothetical protein
MSRDRRAPRYATCDHCGRNQHKVALRLPRGRGTHYHNWPVTGLCGPCFAGAGSSWEGWSLVYDRRGARAKAAHPMPAELAAPPERETRTGPHGRRLWAACGHPAELDINERCYTCGAAPDYGLERRLDPHAPWSVIYRRARERAEREENV